VCRDGVANTQLYRIKLKLKVQDDENKVFHYKRRRGFWRRPDYLIVQLIDLESAYNPVYSGGTFSSIALYGESRYRITDHSKELVKVMERLTEMLNDEVAKLIVRSIYPYGAPNNLLYQQSAS
jgi:hypothetical protein